MPPDRPREPRFAWRGMSLWTPADWDLAAVSGSVDRGRCTLDDPNMRRLELSWRTSRKPKDLNAAAVSYVKEVVRSRGRPPTTPEPRDDLRFGDADARVAAWPSDDGVEILGTSWCETCRRLSHVHLYLKKAEVGSELPRDVLGTYRDHPAPGAATWRFFDVSLALPTEWLLQREQFRTAFLRLDFARARARLAVLRLGVARVLLKGRDVEAWLREFMGKDLKPYALEAEPWEHPDGPGVSLAGASRRRLWRPAAGEVRLMAWRVEETDRLCVVSCAAPAGELPDVAALACALRDTKAMEERGDLQEEDP